MYEHLKAAPALSLLISSLAQNEPKHLISSHISTILRTITSTMQLFPPIKPGPLVPKQPLNPYMKHRLGGWLPKHPDDFLRWLRGVVAIVREAKKSRKLAEEHASIKKLRELIMSNTQVRMYFSLMFEEVRYHHTYGIGPQCCVRCSLLSRFRMI